MRSFVIFFLAGILLLQFFPVLPAVKWGVILLLVLLVLHYGVPRAYKDYLRCINALGIGFVWVLFFSHHQLAWTLPSPLEGKPVLVKGYIASLPKNAAFGTSFLFSLRKFDGQTAHALINITWRNPPISLQVGDKWQYRVRLKRIHGLMNPNTFDYEAWAFQQGIRAGGYIVPSPDNILLSSHWYHFGLDRIRQHLKENIEKNLPLTNTSPWIVALIVGERQGISPANWEVLRNTGTNHLMAIAGLHIGLMAGFFHMAMSWLWKRSTRLMLMLPACEAGAIGALGMALTYSALAGFSIPTQRACIMLSAFMLTYLLRRKAVAWQAWCIALGGVLLINPLTVLDASFWLSFGSVALILYGMKGRLQPTGFWWKWGRIQWVIALGLIPLSIGLFQQCSWISFLANSIAIPVVGFVIVPLCLLGSFLLIFSTAIGITLLEGADKLLSVLWAVLTYFSKVSWASWYHVVPHLWMIIVGCVGMFFLLLPAGFPGRYLGIIWLLPLFMYQPPAPKEGEAIITLLDVGQGLSVVVQTRQHILVFDAGAKLGENADRGESIVVPFLRSLQTKTVDMLMISHGDNDHIGGADAILNQLAVKTVKTSVPDKIKTQATYCLQGDTWEWDKVRFDVLYPSAENLGLDNDSSCVLRISSGNQHVLLTGDIEKFAERSLVEHEKDQLAAALLIAPHHGSKTSAENAFLDAVKPISVLFPIGYRNRYHFPHPSVIAKYTARGILQYDSVKAGAIQYRLQPNQVPQLLGCYRLMHPHYW